MKTFLTFIPVWMLISSIVLLFVWSNSQARLRWFKAFLFGVLTATLTTIVLTFIVYLF